ncbi:MAG TPA: hypothetical protein VN923_04525 [Thermoanaerobaculia bacterium]|nr:hypothetical protein [Thermoanaerobaculia bacterium]
MIRRIAFALSFACALPALAAQPPASAAEPPASVAEPFRDSPLAVVRAKAESGDVAAQFELANRLAFGGEGVAEDDAAAIPWYRKAAEQGHANAQHVLGVFYYHGRGVRRDEAEAIKWWRRAAEQGQASAQYWLAGEYKYGLGGLPESPAEAARWYRKSAEQGNAHAQSSLGDLYESGLGVPQSDAEAVAWYRKAADQNEVTAQTALAGMYADGRGVAKDEKEAAHLYLEAADSGFNVAMTYLGDAYAEGRGITKSTLCAAYWLSLAAQRGFPVAEDGRDAAMAQLSAAERADVARRLAATTVPDEGLLMRPLCPSETVTITITDASPVEVMAIFRTMSGYPILGLEKETRPVTINVDDVSWETALTETLKGLGYSWAREGDAIRATPVARQAS